MNFMDKTWQMAKSNIKRIALPEGDEERTLKAAEIISKEKLAQVILLGDENNIKEKAKSLGVNLQGIEICDIQKFDKKELYINEFVELRKAKGMTREKAEETLKDSVYFATMMLKMGHCDGLVSGAVHSTGDLLRPGLQIVKTAPGISIVSSFFLMIVPNSSYGDNGTFLFADCAVNPNPTAEELASIAISTADTAKSLCKMDSKVAMLSFSTKGSAKHELVEKVIKATEIVKEKRSDIEIDGELQLDAAIVPSVAEKKAKGSNVAGKANVLVFPDLQSGNIGYKLVERLAGAEAIGPICQGFAKPINDLSRGCSVSDIVNVVAITAVQAQGNK